MAIMLVMLPRPAVMLRSMELEACCMPMKAAAKLLTNRALLPVEDLETITCATVVPAQQICVSVRLEEVARTGQGRIMSTVWLKRDTISRYRIEMTHDVASIQDLPDVSIRVNLIRGSLQANIRNSLFKACLNGLVIQVHAPNGILILKG